MSEENKDENRSNKIYDVAEEIYNFAIEKCSKKDLGPADLIAALAICIVNSNHIYAIKGEEREAFEHLLNGLRVLFDDIEEQAKIVEAMGEKIIADLTCKIQ